MGDDGVGVVVMLASLCASSGACICQQHVKQRGLCTWGGNDITLWRSVAVADALLTGLGVGYGGHSMMRVPAVASWSPILIGLVRLLATCRGAVHRGQLMLCQLRASGLAQIALSEGVAEQHRGGAGIRLDSRGGQRCLF